MNPRKRLCLASLLVLACSAPLLPAQPSAPDLNAITSSAVWRIHNRAASAAPDEPGAVRLDAREGDGIAWLVGSDFESGTIELRLRGANQPGQSFVGLAFRAADDDTYDAVYFRPFNFKNSDPTRAARAVQYVSMPDHPWPRLRQQHPGKYEAAINPVPDPDGWFRARLVFENRKVSVFVNEDAKPCLVVNELSNRRGGLIGLWVGNNSSGDFAALRITPLTPKS